ncbi:hypothetical protein L873DRAFT_1669104 [Choiromyces venosus 120613-1]|uniref:Uncharacterized protein n=1 Tax=Choiromyces venosus 120613-1 TaxID=1336337 RepID=A0A3N4JZJ5_9PEZI|nr:hypothetical protein L873DRAFT_1669104 [Choiromyces venosus 120613-1]
MLSRTARVAHPRFTRSIRVWGKRWETEIRDGKRMDRRSNYVPGRGWVVDRTDEDEYDGGEIDLITLRRVPRVQNSRDPDGDRTMGEDDGRNTGFLEGFLQDPSSSPSSSYGSKSAVPPQKMSASPSGVAAATPTYPDPEQVPPPLPPRPTQPLPPSPRDKSESSSSESDSDSDVDILIPSDVRSSAGRSAKNKYEVEIERERRMRREAMILEWEKLREQEEEEESAMHDIRAYKIMRAQKEAQKREAERREIEKREAERREAEKLEMRKREEERREERRPENQKSIEIEMEMERERILREAKMKAEKESIPARENKEWDWSGTDTPTAEDIYKTSQYPPTQKYFALTRNPSTNDFNFTPLPLALSPTSPEQTTPIKVLENMQSPEKFIAYWGVVQRLGFEIVAGEGECVVVRASAENANDKMQSILQEIEGMREFETKPVLEEVVAAPPKGFDAIAADIASKIGLGGKPSSVVEEPPNVAEEPPKVFEEFSSIVGEASKPVEKEPEPVEQEVVKPVEEIIEAQAEESAEAHEPVVPKENLESKPLDAKPWDQIVEDAKSPEVVEEKSEPAPVYEEIIVTPPMKAAAEEPIEIETNKAWQDKYQFSEKPETTVQEPVEETIILTEAPKPVEEKEVPKAEEPAKTTTKEWETTTNPWTFVEESTPTPPPQPSSPAAVTAETILQPSLSPAEEVARENWEKKRGSLPPSPSTEDLPVAKPALEKSTEVPGVQQQQQQGKSKHSGKKPRRKIFWMSIWLAGVTGGTSYLLEEYC